jgi:DNA-binding PucR family transcriptional regulator
MAVYVDEAQARFSGAAAKRLQTVHVILRGEEVDRDAATNALGHNLLLWQTGLVLWAAEEAESSDAVVALETLARDIANALKAPRPLTIASGPRTVWAWVATAAEPDLPSVLSGNIFRGRAGLRAAIGVPATGVGGFRTSHAEAVMAQKVAMDSGSPRPATVYRDVELVSFASSNPTAMRTFVTRELGELAQPGSAAARLRETLTVYLQFGSSARAADELGVHKNTILYRLQQAEELLGHAIDERRLPLQVALQIVAVYGESIL